MMPSSVAMFFMMDQLSLLRPAGDNRAMGPAHGRVPSLLRQPFHHSGPVLGTLPVPRLQYCQHCTAAAEKGLESTEKSYGRHQTKGGAGCGDEQIREESRVPPTLAPPCTILSGPQGTATAGGRPERCKCWLCSSSSPCPRASPCWVRGRVPSHPQSSPSSAGPGLSQQLTKASNERTACPRPRSHRLGVPQRKCKSLDFQV